MKKIMINEITINFNMFGPFTKDIIVNNIIVLSINNRDD